MVVHLRTAAVLALLGGGLLASPVRAAPSDLDPAFGRGGLAALPFGGNPAVPFPEPGLDVVLDHHGRIVVAACDSRHLGQRWAVGRFLGDGLHDPAFGDMRFGSDDSDPQAVVRVTAQDDDKIVMRSVTLRRTEDPPVPETTLRRFTVAGEPDPTFGDQGRVVLPDQNASGLAAQPGRGILIGVDDANGLAVMRLRDDGTTDPSFGDGGTAVNVDAPGATATDVAVQPDGRILVAGGDAIARFTAEGEPDRTFGDDNGVSHRLSQIRRIVLQHDGRIVVAGSDGGEDWALARLLADGTGDGSFGRSGEVMTQFEQGSQTVTGVAEEPGGSLVAAGTAGLGWWSVPPSAALARYTRDGAPDTTFSATGRWTSTKRGPQEEGLGDRGDGVVVLPTGRIVVLGIQLEPGQFDHGELYGFTGGTGPDLADPDGDGVPAWQDRCPHDAGIAPDGCPIAQPASPETFAASTSPQTIVEKVLPGGPPRAVLLAAQRAFARTLAKRLAARSTIAISRMSVVPHPFPFVTAGRADVEWRLATGRVARTSTTILARGTRTRTRPGPANVAVRLTRNGRHRLRAARRLRIVIHTTFTPADGTRAVITDTAMTLARHPRRP